MHQYVWCVGVCVCVAVWSDSRFAGETKQISRLGKRDRAATYSAPYLESDVWASAPATLKEVMSNLELMTGDPNSDVFRCGKEGVRWYTVNDFKGCALKNGETFKYRGKAYTNTDTTHVDSLAMTLSYVCNQQSRRRDIGVTATAIMKTKCA